jgi:hypothetical protein
MVFNNKGTPVARAALQFVGSIAGRPSTWLWGWANDSIPVAATARLAAVRQYGEEQGFDKLTGVGAGWGRRPRRDDRVGLHPGRAGVFHDHAGGAALYFVLDGFERLQS